MTIAKDTRAEVGFTEDAASSDKVTAALTTSNTDKTYKSEDAKFNIGAVTEGYKIVEVSYTVGGGDKQTLALAGTDGVGDYTIPAAKVAGDVTVTITTRATTHTVTVSKNESTAKITVNDEVLAGPYTVDDNGTLTLITNVDIVVKLASGDDAKATLYRDGSYQKWVLENITDDVKIEITDKA